MNYISHNLYLKNKKCIHFVTIVILCYFMITFSAIAQTNTLLHLDVDFAQFRLDEKSVYVEIYYSVPRKDIIYHPVDKGFRAAFQILSQIMKNYSLLSADTLMVTDRIQSLEQISAGQKFADISPAILTAGNYLLKSSLFDLLSQKSLSVTDSISIDLFSYDSLSLSSIELASSITTQPKTQSKFNKNRLRVIPNAERIYGKDLPYLFFYAEAYNFDWSEAAKSSQYQVNYQIKDINGNIVLALTGKEKNKPGMTGVVYGSIDISQLVSGSYVFGIEVKDLYNMQTAGAEKQFFIFNRSDFIKETDINQQIAHANIKKYQQMNDTELDQYFDQLKYIANREEKKMYSQLNLEGKKNFIISFWTARDPNQATLINEREVQYNELLKVANEKFSNIFQQGWESDRGRVLLLYGLPDTKDIVPASIDTKAYEIWYYYNIEGGVQFVFVDKRRNGNFELVHSTKRGEISDPNWRINHARI